MYFNQEVLTFIEENLCDLYVSEIAYFINMATIKYPTLDFINHVSFIKLTFEERAEIYARLLHWGESIIDQYGTVKTGENEYSTYANFKYVFMVRFLVNCEENCEDWEIYEKEFERKNYYNLPNFKEYWENAKEIKREEYIDPV